MIHDDNAMANVSHKLEMHSGRTLSVEGEKHVQCIVQSVSVRIQPLTSGEGQLFFAFVFSFKEQSEKFGPVVEVHLFKSENFHIEASKL